jgi:3-carboxy-cis,cis-muconate cycloisomerase
MAVFSARSQLQALLDVEVALAAAAADVGLIPASAVDDIRSAARSDRFDVEALEADAANAGNIVIPLVNRLTETVAAINPSSARYLHFGATSQDILDTALVVQLRASKEDLAAPLSRAVTALAAIARAHASTPMAGRTWLQQASPTTFGLKAAGWLDLIARSHERLAAAFDRCMVVQLGGASGTLAALGPSGGAVTEAFARRLSLGVPDLPWHTHRDRLAEIACAMGITCGALGKVGRDLVLLAQSELGEAAEAAVPGRGASSSMPHKRNPVRAVAAFTASIRAPGLVATMLAAMPQEHERAAGGWQAEWKTMPELTTVTSDAAQAIAEAVSNLTVSPDRMRENLGRSGGIAVAEALALALRERLPRADAMALVERLSRTAERDGRTLREVASEDAEIQQWFSAREVESLLQPENFLGSAGRFIDRVLQRWSV